MPKTFQVAVDLSKWDGKHTQTIAEDAITASELQQWVNAQEAAMNRYIVFPTTELMTSWRSVVVLPFGTDWTPVVDAENTLEALINLPLAELN